MTAGRGGKGWLEVADLVLVELPPEPAPQPASARPRRGAGHEAAPRLRRRPGDVLAGRVGGTGGLDRRPRRAARARRPRRRSRGLVREPLRRRPLGGRDGLDDGPARSPAATAGADFLALPESRGAKRPPPAPRGPRDGAVRAEGGRGEAARLRRDAERLRRGGGEGRAARLAGRGTSPASSRTGRSSASTGTRTRGSSRRTARSRPARGLFSVEPFLLDGERLVTWADVTTRHALAGRRPADPVGDVGDEGAHARDDGARGRRCPARRRSWRATASRTGRQPAKRVRLVLAIRPLQVNPPWQFLGTPGGVSEIRSLAFENGRAVVNGTRARRPARGADRVPGRRRSTRETSRTSSARERCRRRSA